MDRRNFFKTVLATPLITPFLLASKHHYADSELFMIADEPQRFISPILAVLIKDLAVSTRSLAFMNDHPREMELRYILTQNGWSAAKDPRRASLAISFSFLQQNARPSFSLVRGGKIQDIRSHSLSSLWQEMNRRHTPSSCLTTASFKQNSQPAAPAESVSVYKDGRPIAKLSLEHDTERSFKTSKGRITVRVQQGGASVTESFCRFQICCHTAPITQPGERIICAPNHFLLEVDGSGSVDTVIG